MSQQGKSTSSARNHGQDLIFRKCLPGLFGSLATSAVVAAFLLFVPVDAAHATADDLSVTDYHYVGRKRIGRAHYDYTYTITVTNAAEALQNVVGTASSTASNTTIIRADVPLGDIGAGSSVESTESFTFRLDRRSRFDPASIVWSFTADPVEPGNTPPVADAGPDQILVHGTTVSLDGSGSSDSDGDTLSYSWTLVTVPSGSTATLDSNSAVMPTFFADVPGAYIAQLVVNDGNDDSVPDIVTISTENTLPVADAGLDQTVPVGASTIVFGGASFDANGDSLTYAWTLLARPAGSAAALTSATDVQTGLTIDVAGSYEIELIVNDGYADSAPDTVAITTENTAPVADAGGPYEDVEAGDTVDLDGTFSFDIDDDPLDYFWSILSSPDGSTALLNDAAMATARLVTDIDGLYVVQLIVNDGTVDSDPDTATITAIADNAAPTALATADPTSVEPGASVQLDGSGSSDPEGADLTYLWSLATPDGSNTVLSSLTAVAPTFTPDVAGSYVATLVVNDGELDSDVASVVIAAASSNNPPTLAAIGNRVMFLGSTLNFRLFGVDPDVGDVLTYSLTTAPANMGAVPATGDVSFTPSASQLGINNVIARVADAGGLFDTQAFTVEVRQAPVTPPDNNPPTLAPISNATRVVGAALNVQTSAFDPDAGDTLTYTLPLAPVGMSIDDTGLIAFTPAANQVGLHDVTVQVADPFGAVALQSFIVTVKAINRPPLALDDLYDARIGEKTSISAPGVLTNDSDPDGDALSAALVSDVANGVLDFRTDGSFDYTPGLPEEIGPVELEVQCEYEESLPAGKYGTNGTITIGDVDNDGVQEIVGAWHISSALRPELWIMNAEDCSIELAGSPAVVTAGGLTQGPHLGLLDIDGDGDLEIIGPRERLPDSEGGFFDYQHLMAIHHDGSLAWPGNGGSESLNLLPAPTALNTQGGWRYSGPTFADLDGNGTIEIIMVVDIPVFLGARTGIAVFNSADGSLLWEYEGVDRAGPGKYEPPTVVDLDRDGTMEIISHSSVVDHLGNEEFILPSDVAVGSSQVGHLTVAVANFDGDPDPEIIGRDDRNHYLFEHDGTLAWRKPQPNTSQSQITVADFDNDGEVEFAYNTSFGNFTATGGGFMVVWDTDGETILWSHENVTALHIPPTNRLRGPSATAFDANKDGYVDLVMHYSFGNTPASGIYFFDGRDGAVMEFLPILAADNAGDYQRFVTIADVDDDGEAEVISSFSGGSAATRIWQGTAENPLPPAPSVRDQWIYNAAMVDDFTGNIITNPTPHWLQPGLNGYNLVIPPDRVYLAEKCSFTWEGYSANDPNKRTSFTNGALLVGDVDNDGDTEIVGWNDGHATSQVGGLFVLNGDDCSTQLRGSPELMAAGGFSRLGQVHMSLVDLDGDGDLEILGRRRINADGAIDRQVRLLAANHDGTLFWPADSGASSQAVGFNLDWASGPSLADLDADGDVEIIMRWEKAAPGSSSLNIGGIAVFNGSDGTLAWEFEGLPKLQNGGAISAPVVIADIDVDGTMEVIVDRSVISHEGTLEFVLPIQAKPGPTAPVDHLFTAVANFDSDPFAEIIAHDKLNHYMFDHQGNVVWQIPRIDETQSQITVGDFDGDGQMEYALQREFLGANLCGSYTGYMAVFEADGAPLWDHQAIERFHSTCGVQFNYPVATAFDANADGAHDIVIHHRGDNLTTDRNGLYIFNGRDGSLLTKYTFPANSESYRSVALADVDRDGEAEVVLSWTGGSRADTVVLEGVASKPLPSAPPIVNQQFMHRGLVAANGQILTNPVPHWLQRGANGFLAIPLQPSPLAGTTDSFTYMASDGSFNSNVATVTFDVQPAGTAPVFLTQPDTQTTVGFPYEYSPRVVDVDAGDSISFTLAAAPAGMTMAATGRLNWLPETEGSFQVSIIASDTIGFATPQSFTLVVGQPVVVPDVIAQPQATAESVLANANLLIGSVRTSTHPTIAAGAVFEQSPIAGSVAEFGGKVDLQVSTGPAPEDTDDDGDGFSENMGDCNDGDASIGPGAGDPAGDGIDQDCDGVDGNLVLSAILVSPATSTVLTNQSVSLTATGIFEDGTSQNLTGVVSWNNGPTFSSSAAGTFTATASRDGIDGTATVNVASRVVGDTAPPVAVITAPAKNSTVTEPVNVIGSASDANFLRYELAYAPVGESSFTTIANGTASVSDGVLGQFDPTVLLNDLYTIRLRVYDLGGNMTVDEIVVQVDEDLKVGNFTLRFVDLAIPMAGLPITVTRTYDSREKRKGDFGAGWKLEYNSLRLRTNRVLGTGWEVLKQGFAYGLVQTDAHLVSLTLPDGRVELFEMVVSPSNSAIVPFPPLSQSVSFRPLPGTLGVLRSIEENTVSILDPQPGTVELRRDSDGRIYDPQRFSYRTADGTLVEFHKQDGIEKIVDPNGNTLTFGAAGISHSAGRSVVLERDTQDRITQLTDPEGNQQFYVYDANGDLRHHTDAAGFSTRFSYNSDHGIIRIQDQLNRVQARNEYDSGGRLTRSTSADGRVIEFGHNVGVRQEVITDTDGSISVLDYDERGDIVRATDPLGQVTTITRDAEGNALTVTNPLGETMTHTYDARNNMLTESDALGNTTSYTYNSQDKITTITDALGRTIVNTYDARGNLLTTTDAMGNVARLTYDRQGNIATRTDALGNSIQYSYDAFGNQLGLTDARGNTESSVYDANGFEIGATNRAGASVSLTRDPLSRVVAFQDPLGNIARTEYAESGAIKSVTDRRGNITRQETDTLGRVLAVVDAVNQRTENRYDLKGNLVEITNARGEKTALVQDAIQRGTQFTTPAGSAAAVSYDGAGRVASHTDANGNISVFEYDAAGRRTKVTDALGFETRFEYDTVGNLTRLIDANGNVSLYRYDALNRRTRVTQPDGSFEETTYDSADRVTSTTDALGRTTTFGYDANGNLVRVTDALGGQTNYVYDANNNLLLQTDARGNSTAYAYDANARLVSRRYPDGARETRSYDAADNLASITDPNGNATVFTYDANDRLTGKTFADGSGESYVYDAIGEVLSGANDDGAVSYSYDADNKLVRLVNPDGSEINYIYDAAGNRIRDSIETSSSAGALTTDYSYDALNRLTTVTDTNGLVTSYSYDPVGDLVSISYPNGTMTTYSYDTNRRLVRIEHNRGTVTLASYTYDLDAVGDRTRVTDVVGRHVEYAYDSLRRVIRESHFDASNNNFYELQYSYDAVGNRTTLTGPGGITVYSYDVTDKLLRAGSTNFSYDANGNLLASTGIDGVRTYEFDHENLLTSVSGPGGNVSFAYDAPGQRISSSNGLETTKFLVDPASPTGFAQVLADYYDSGQVVQNVFGNGLLSRNDGIDSRYYLRDANHNVRLLTDVDGGATDTYDYSAFGEVISRGGVTENPYTFAGDRSDPTTGLTYLRARFYDPASGRFLGRDPLAGDLDRPVTQHRFLYAAANPITFADPSGEEPITLFTVVASAAVATTITVGVGVTIGGAMALNSAYQAYYANPAFTSGGKARTRDYRIRLCAGGNFTAVVGGGGLSAAIAETRAMKNPESAEYMISVFGVGANVGVGIAGDQSTFPTRFPANVKAFGGMGYVGSVGGSAVVISGQFEGYKIPNGPWLNTSGKTVGLAPPKSSTKLVGAGGIAAFAYWSALSLNQSLLRGTGTLKCN